MAHYAVTHSCGHVESHQLFGPGKDRQKKIAWLETSKCKECWKADQDAARAESPITAEVIFNTFSNGVFLAVTGGNTYPIKDALKLAGCSYLQYQENNDLLGLKAPKKAWMIAIDPENVDQTVETIQKLMDAGVTQIIDTTNPLSASIAKRLAE